MNRLEAAALMAQHQADAAWLRWCQHAVRNGVRIDVTPRSLATLPVFVEVEVRTAIRCGARGGSKERATDKRRSSGAGKG